MSTGLYMYLGPEGGEKERMGQESWLNKFNFYHNLTLVFFKWSLIKKEKQATDICNAFIWQKLDKKLN